MLAKFCSEHRVSLYTASNSSLFQWRKRSKIHKPRNCRSLWCVTPKQSICHQQLEQDGFYLPSGSDVHGHGWPSCSTIAFVEFTSAQSEQMKCVSCLVQHSEVLFVSLLVTGTFRYATHPLKLFKPCREFAQAWSMTVKETKWSVLSVYLNGQPEAWGAKLLRKSVLAIIQNCSDSEVPSP